MEQVTKIFLLIYQWPLLPFIIATMFFVPLIVKRIASSLKPKTKFWFLVGGIVWVTFSVFNLWPVSNEMFFMLLKVWFVFPLLLVLSVNALIWAILESRGSFNEK